MIVPIIVTPYVSRVLLADGVGQYSFSYSIITYFTIFASLGFGYYAQREIAKYQDSKQKQSKIFWEINIVRLIPVSISIIVNLILILTGVYGKNSLLMSLMMINIVAIAFDITFLFQGNENFGNIVLKNIIVKIFATIAMFIFVKGKSDLWIYCLLNSLALIIGNLSLWPSAFKIVEKIKVKELKPLKHLPGTLKLFIPTIATSIYVVLDKSLIGIITKSDFENGYYEQAEKIVKMAMTIVTCVGTVMIPRNTYELEQGNMDKVKQNIYTASHFVWIIGIPLMFGIIGVANNLIPWFLGDGFDKSIVLLQLFASLIPIIGLSNILGIQYLLPKKEDSKFAFCLTMGAVINFTLNIILIRKYQSIGATIASISAELIITITMLIIVRKDLSIKEITKTSIKPIISSAAMLIVLLIIGKNINSTILNTFILVLIGIIIYFAIILLLKDSLVLETLKKVLDKKKTEKNQINL